MPEYIASGSHIFQGEKYRFLVLRRYRCDLHSMIKNRRVDLKCVLIIASQIIDILEHFHDKGYAHSDIKSENLMIGTCTYNKEKNFNFDDRENTYNRNNSSAIKKRHTGNTVEYGGSNPMRSCRVSSTPRTTSMYDEMVQSHYLRPNKNVSYCQYYDESEYDYNANKDDNYSDASSVTSSVVNINNNKKVESKTVTEDRIFLIDFGLASKFMDANGHHRPFCMDQRRAHDGTLEFTSRDAHMGAHSRRSDLECLGYNLIYWCQGTLPWKNEKLMQQPDQVHHMKEYFMTDVKFMLHQVYGKLVPNFLGEYLEYVANLKYDERPDYGYCRHLFEKEFVDMGYSVDDMQLNVNEIKQKVKKLPPTPENLKSIKNVKSIMKLGVQLLPFKETHGSNKISPKNLRSKSDAKSKKQKSKFSWTEILSSNPDQIARERAEKEFEREQLAQTPVVAKYSGRPTYAILEIENRLKFKDKLDAKEECDTPDMVSIKGYTKPMMDILRRRQNYLMSKFEKTKKPISKSPPERIESDNYDDTDEEVAAPIEQPKKSLRKRKAAPTKSVVFTETIFKKKLRFSQNNHSNINHDQDETSCSSHASSSRSKSHSSYSEDYHSDDSNSRFSSNSRRRQRNKKVKSPVKTTRGRKKTLKKSELNFSYSDPFIDATKLSPLYIILP